MQKHNNINYQYCNITIVVMAGVEYFSAEGFRVDGRRPHEIRKISCVQGVAADADGSAYLEQGNTKVIAKVWGPREPTKAKARQSEDKCYINCQYAMAMYSTTERRVRTTGDRKTSEVSQHLKQIFDAVILTDLYPRSQIDIFVEVLQADGSSECVATNACSLAVMDAGVPMKDYVCACSASFLSDVCMLDTNHLEESAAQGALLHLALLPKSDEILLLEITSRLHQDQLNALLDVVSKGCRDLFTVFDAYVRTRVDRLAQQLELT